MRLPRNLADIAATAQEPSSRTPYAAPIASTTKKTIIDTALGSVELDEDVAVVIPRQRLLEIPGEPRQHVVQRHPVRQVEAELLGRRNVRASRSESRQLLQAIVRFLDPVVAELKLK